MVCAFFKARLVARHVFFDKCVDARFCREIDLARVFSSHVRCCAEMAGSFQTPDQRMSRGNPYIYAISCVNMRNGVLEIGN